MNWKKLCLIFLVVSLTIVLVAPAAQAKKKKKKGMVDDILDLGLDIGVNVFGGIVYGKVNEEWKAHENSSSTDLTEYSDSSGITGSLDVGPMVGIHGNLHFKGWIVRIEFGYGYQKGQVKADFSEINTNEINLLMENIKFGVGFGKSLVNHKIAHPYIIGVLDYHYLMFKDFDWNKSAGGSGIGVGALLGVDAKFKKHYFIGGGIRADFIYALNPMKTKDKQDGNRIDVQRDITLGWIPVAFYITGGYVF